MTKDRAALIMRWLNDFPKIRTDMSPTKWVALKLSCTTKQAEKHIAQARKIMDKQPADKPVEPEAECPNCSRPIKKHPQNGCVLAALIGVLRDRETKSEDELYALHKNCNVDAMWDDVGRIIDRLEAGEYNHDDEEEAPAS